MQNFFSNMVWVVILALLSFFCCPPLGLILGIIGVATCQGDAKRNAMIVLVVAVVAIILNIILYNTGVVKIPQFGQ